MIHHVLRDERFYCKTPQIGAAVMVALPLLLYFLVVLTNESSIFRSLEGFLIFAMICWTVGLVAFAYVHFMWVKPSRHLLLGLQQVDLALLKDQAAHIVFLSSLPSSSCPGC